MMNNKEFADKAIRLSKQQTAYMLGAFCWSATDANIRRLLNQYAENYNWLWKANEIKGRGYVGDCVGIIKGILWNFNFDLDKLYGGATYCANGVPDIDADTMINMCSGVSNNFNDVQVGEAVWMPGHIGIIISSTQVVECTPVGSCGVQITNLHGRGWQKHGKLPWVDYSTSSTEKPSVLPPGQSNKAIPAKFFDRNIARTYIVSPSIGLNIRKGPNMSYSVIKAVPQGTRLNNYGYYSKNGNETWLYVQTQDGTVGYVHSDYVY